MKLTAQEKQEVIRLVEGSELGVNQTLLKLGFNNDCTLSITTFFLDDSLDL